MAQERFTSKNSRPTNRLLPVRRGGLTLVVVALTLFSWFGIDVSRGFSLIALPAIIIGVSAFLKLGRTILSLAVLNVLFHAAFGLMGPWFLPLIGITTCALVYTISRSRTLCVVTVIVLCLSWTALLPALGRPSRGTRISSNTAHLASIFQSIERYRMQRGGYPEKLSQLAEMGADIREFRALGSLDRLDLLWKGPLRLYWGRPDPRLARKVTVWADVDTGNYE